MIKPLVPPRPEEGPEAIQVYPITNEDKTYIAYEYGIKKKPLEIIKLFIKNKYPEEFEKYEKYDDWNKCFLNRWSVRKWALNLATTGNVIKQRTYPKACDTINGRKREAEMVRAKVIIDEIKATSKSNKELAHNLTSAALAARLDVSRMTANRYLNELEGINRTALNGRGWAQNAGPPQLAITANVTKPPTVTEM